MRRIQKAIEEQQLKHAREDFSVVLASIDREFKKLLASGLNRRAVIALLHDSTKLPRKTIEKVLIGITQLKDFYTSERVGTA